jgi:hypothetical protein
VEDSSTGKISISAIIGLIIAIIGLLLSAVPIINNFAFVLALLALILGIVAIFVTRKGKRRGKGIAIATVILAVLAGIIVIEAKSSTVIA